MEHYSIRVEKEYFNFAASHFMMFPDGSREPLHGHNYRVRLKGQGERLQGDVVLDFLHIKPIVKELCDQLDHKLLMPNDNPFLSFEKKGDNVTIKTQSAFFSIPKSDVLFLPIANTSAELMASYFAREVTERVWERYRFRFLSLDVEVEESPGQSAIYHLSNNT